MRCQRAHPENSDAHEVVLDQLSPTAAPVLLFRADTADRYGAVAALPASEHHWLYLGRLVVVRGPKGNERRGFVEVIVDDQIVVRWL